jgi:hypothetical protein
MMRKSVGQKSGATVPLNQVRVVIRTGLEFIL